jgi:methionyl aminopeptidase
MNDEIFDLYMQAGKIAGDVLRKGAAKVRPGVPLLDVVVYIEELIEREGAGVAFPLNVSRNEDAAHDTASAGDERLFETGDLVKLDLGVHLEGYIADTATTVDLGDNPVLVEASKVALDRAVELVRPGITVGELGTAIQHEIETRGFRPISNLTGHALDQYIVHQPPNVPNISIQGGAVLEEGLAFAIEPFASTGAGRVSEKPRCEIFQQIDVKPIRLASARRVMESIRNRRGLPFARRWLPVEKTDIALSALLRNHLIRGYPVLADLPGSRVSQHEHTLIVTADGCEVTTR